MDSLVGLWSRHGIYSLHADHTTRLRKLCVRWTGPTVCKSLISISMYFQSGQMALSCILIDFYSAFIHWCRVLKNLPRYIVLFSLVQVQRTQNKLRNEEPIPCLENLYLLLGLESHEAYNLFTVNKKKLKCRPYYSYWQWQPQILKIDIVITILCHHLYYQENSDAYIISRYRK